jgi:uncharacterized protein YjbI with pentapeptide repeats
VVLVQVPAPWWRVLASEWRVLLPAVVSLAVLLLGVLLRWRISQESHQASAAPIPPDRPMRTLRSWVIPVGAVLVAAVTGIAVVWLQNAVPAVGDQVQRAQLRVDSIRTGLTIGAAVTGAFALLLAFRRQQLAERIQQATEYDAGEKRVTDLYVKAADQLGSDKAPVRLAGLYALERLAQDNPVHRQSIVEVICAYLRMPYTPPDDQSEHGADRPPVRGDDSTLDKPSVQATNAGDINKPAIDPREERQVRLAAQRILARHLRPETENGDANPTYWGPEIVLDLTEATLIDANFADCHLHNAVFTEAIFNGHTWFVGATFKGTAVFVDATFNGHTWFKDATFKGSVWFMNATFNDAAFFGEATFNGHINFKRATFNHETGFNKATLNGTTEFVKANFKNTIMFDEATFNGTTRFDEAVFSETANFEEAKFNGTADFYDAAFNGNTRFESATFNGATGFEGAIFDDFTSFGDATFNGDAGFAGVAFSGAAGFGSTTFNKSARFARAAFNDTAFFVEAAFNQTAGFEGAIFGGAAGFEGATFGGAAGFDRVAFSGTAGFERATFRSSKSFWKTTLRGEMYEDPPVTEKP